MRNNGNLSQQAMAISQASASGNTYVRRNVTYSPSPMYSGVQSSGH